MWIGNLTQLTELNLHGNDLSVLPDSIQNLVNLDRLCLWDNRLTHLPEWIGNLTNLTSLDLSVNQLTCLPDSIKNLKNLDYLCLYWNELSSSEEQRIEEIFKDQHVDIVFE